MHIRLTHTIEKHVNRLEKVTQFNEGVTYQIIREMTQLQQTKMI